MCQFSTSIGSSAWWPPSRTGSSPGTSCGRSGSVAERSNTGCGVACCAFSIGTSINGEFRPTPRGPRRAPPCLPAAKEQSSATMLSANLYEMRRQRAGPVDVTVVGRRVRVQGIRAHVARTLHRADVTTLRGIAVTSPARTLLDIAPLVTASELAAAARAGADQAPRHEARHRRRDRAGAAARGRGGVASAARRAGLHPLARGAAAGARCCAPRELPQPDFNACAEGYEVDALWRRERVVLEFDSYAFHATRAAFERDRRRTAALQRGRYVVLRTTWNELTRESHALIARTAEALALALSDRLPTASPARAGP